ncbi:MAG: lipid A biosynthesis acyltransferase [Sulfurovum sp.]|nr:lipid A biosynthesis acyltransferase [Sulfurovum sp.]MCB4757985.1 lipid A biosynthesis acyltransferase [Sulfurovum sp.]MCB4761262.1 lipid A biosynthesis acyltransferase [Sulfurovum sp.]MCB4764573.1 lipid A biosynthesis acyltransferase [Sulfurovum sp.]MCB4766802.1 lipid A biosynthesis acyltransferase [Sulfurovum sp.]
MKDFFSVILFYTFKVFISLLPDRFMYTIMKSISYMIYRFDHKHRKIVETNLNLAYGEEISKEKKKEIAKKTYLNILLLLVDFIRNHGISHQSLLKKVTFQNEHILTNALKNKKRVILIGAHYGNWELLLLSIAARFGLFTGVGRKLNSPMMDRILKKNRQQFNMEMLDKKGAMKSMIQTLKNNRILGLLVDQNTSDNEGILIDFFGKQARHTPSAAILARRCDALIVPVFITMDSYPHHTVTFYDPIVVDKTDDKDLDIRLSVQKQAALTEQIIRQKPEEWFWLHRRWKNQYKEYYQ